MWAVFQQMRPHSYLKFSTVFPSAHNAYKIKAKLEVCLSYTHEITEWISTQYVIKMYIKVFGTTAFFLQNIFSKAL
jgi:hypothetical protein